MNLIILDRDGVINQDSDAYIKSPEEWLPISGSLDAIARLNRAGVKVGVATNQSGLARGYFSIQTLEAMHDKFRSLLATKQGYVDWLKYCPHGPTDSCSCRKPKPGMYQDIAKTAGVSLSGVPVVGDSLRDLLAAEAVSAQPVLVLTGKGKKTQKDPNLPANTLIFANLDVAVTTLLNNRKSNL